MKGKILVIDDEPDLQLLITQRFQTEIESGELVFEFASDGLEGLKKVESNNNYHVIVTDLKMPIMDGLELLAELKKREVLSKALVASAYDDMENFRSAMNSGAFDFIVKPIAFNDLKVTIYKAIADYNNNIEGLEARKKLIEAVKEKEAAILRERLRISRDLHDDIGASISGISISAITAQKKLSENNIHEAGSLLHHIAQDAHDMVTSMSEMVWLINPKNDSMEKLFDRIRTYATHVLPAKDILFSFNDEVSLNPLILSIEERKNIYLIFKEAINNAAKYSECSEVNLIVQKNKSTVDFILSDNGNGFDKSKVQFGNGLKNMQQRADEINGKFSTESNSNGTTIKLSVVLA